jgi:hypothetical protein
MSQRYAAVYTGTSGPVSALFEARDLHHALRTLQEQGDMWFVMMRDDLRLQARSVPLPRRGFRPVPQTVTPDYALYLCERERRRARTKSRVAATAAPPPAGPEPAHPVTATGRPAPAARC